MKSIQAFPIQASEYGGHGSDAGMTVGDCVAIQALAALIGRENKDDHLRGKKGVPILVKFAHEYAEAFLEERAQRGVMKQIDKELGE